MNAPTKQAVQAALDKALAENDALRTQLTQNAEIDRRESTEDTLLHTIKLNEQDAAIGSGIWQTVSLERGAVFNADGTVQPFEIAGVVPGAWADTIVGLFASFHPYTAENAMDGAIYGCNNQIGRKRDDLRSQHLKIRGATRAYLREEDAGRRETKKESLDRMTFYHETLKQQAREFVLLRGAYKQAWVQLFGGEVHMPRASRIASRQQIDVDPGQMDATVAAALAVTGGTDGLQLDRGGRGPYQPVQDGTVTGSPSREARMGVDAGYEDRTHDPERTRRNDEALERDGLPF